MSEGTTPPWDPDALEQAVEGATSLEEIEAWLLSQPGVKSVRLADHLAKSHPPQRDFVVELEDAGGGATTKVVNVVDFAGQRFQFRTLRDR